jgi:hypothetical protein
VAELMFTAANAMPAKASSAANSNTILFNFVLLILSVVCLSQAKTWKGEVPGVSEPSLLEQADYTGLFLISKNCRRRVAPEGR